MLSEKEIVEEARSWLGTRYVHGQGLKGVGTDCGQFVAAVMRWAGRLPQNYKIKRYTHDWALYTEQSFIIEELEKYARQIKLEEVGLADALVFKTGRCKCVNHIALYAGNKTMIHSVSKRGVIEEEISRYAKRLNSCWRFTC